MAISFIRTLLPFHAVVRTGAAAGPLRCFSYSITFPGALQADSGGNSPPAAADGSRAGPAGPAGGRAVPLCQGKEARRPAGGKKIRPAVPLLIAKHCEVCYTGANPANSGTPEGAVPAKIPSAPDI